MVALSIDPPHWRQWSGSAVEHKVLVSLRDFEHLLLVLERRNIVGISVIKNLPFLYDRCLVTYYTCADRLSNEALNSDYLTHSCDYYDFVTKCCIVSVSTRFNNSSVSLKAKLSSFYLLL